MSRGICWNMLLMFEHVCVCVCLCLDCVFTVAFRDARPRPWEFSWSSNPWSMNFKTDLNYKSVYMVCAYDCFRSSLQCICQPFSQTVLLHLKNSTGVIWGRIANQSTAAWMSASFPSLPSPQYVFFCISSISAAHPIEMDPPSATIRAAWGQKGKRRKDWLSEKRGEVWMDDQVPLWLLPAAQQLCCRRVEQIDWWTWCHNICSRHI